MLRCGPLGAVARHGFTTRQLGLRAGASSSPVWTEAVSSVGCVPARLARVRQVHGAAVRVVTAGDLAAPEPDADALVSCEPGVAVAVVVADCVPILLADPQTGTVAAVHAGWRGTAGNVVGNAVASMTRVSGVRPETIVAAVGPSIGACCYDVGEELLSAFAAAGHTSVDVADWFSRDRNGRLRLDLWRANTDLLVHAGVPRTQVHVAGLCTKTHADVFESFRADGERAGRMVAIIVAPGAGPTPQ